METLIKILVCVTLFFALNTPVHARVIESAMLGCKHDFTDAEVLFMASILNGETAYGCDECHKWIACTIARDARRYRNKGSSVYTLHPGRWKGFKGNPSEEYIEIMDNALGIWWCLDAPICKFLGNANDYRYNWTGYGSALVVGNRNGLVVCVEDNSVIVGENKKDKLR